MAHGESRAEINGTLLLLDGEPLNVERHSPDVLGSVLTDIGQKAIVASIEDAYERTVELNPEATVSRQSVTAIYIGDKKSNSLSEYGRLNRTNLYRFIIESRPEHREYWSVIVEAGYSAHIWRAAFGKDSYNMMLRNPETDPVPVTPLEHLPQALGFMEPAATRTIKPQLAEALATDDTEKYQQLWSRLEDENEAAVDRHVASFDESVLPAAQIGRIVAMGNLRVSLRGDEYLLAENGYLADLTDAEEGAYQEGLDEVSELLKTEMSRIKQLRAQL